VWQLLQCVASVLQCVGSVLQCVASVLQCVATVAVCGNCVAMCPCTGKTASESPFSCILYDCTIGRGGGGGLEGGRKNASQILQGL